MFLGQLDGTQKDAVYGPDGYESVRHCHGLGEQVGLPESDQPYVAPDSLDSDAYPREPIPASSRVPRNWPLQLVRHGFRLPTEEVTRSKQKGVPMNRYAMATCGVLWFIAAATGVSAQDTITDKTMVVWAAPANLDQRGGSALTVGHGESRRL